MGMRDIPSRSYSSIKDAVSNGANVGKIEYSFAGSPIIFIWRLRGDGLEYQKSEKKNTWKKLDFEPNGFITGMQVDWSLPVQLAKFIDF